MGKPISTGCQSHYVLTDKAGYVYHQESREDYYDEVVIGQESQILPSYVLLIDLKKKMRNKIAEFQRDVPGDGKKKRRRRSGRGKVDDSIEMSEM